MQEFLTYKDNGNRKFAQQKFASAVSDFSYVINKLKVMGTDEAQLKMICYINRSSCNLMLNKPEEAISDANEAMVVYNTIRDQLDLKKIDAKKLKDDKLTIPISLAFVRRGQVYEAQGNFVEALMDYQTANKIVPESDGEKVIASLYKKLSIPVLKPADSEIGNIYQAYQNITNSEQVTQFVGTELMRLDQFQATQKDIEFLNNKNFARLVFGIMQIYMHDEMITLMCVAIINILADIGVKDVFNGFPVIRTAMNEWRQSVDIIGGCLKFLSYCPASLNQHLIDGQMVPTIINSINIELKEEEFDYAFILLYRLATKKEQLVQIGTSNVIEIINKTKTVGGLVLLSKLSQVPELARAATEEGAIDWVITKLEQNKENVQVVSAASILISQSFLHGEETDGKVSEVLSEEDQKKKDDKLTKYAIKIIDILFPLVKKNSKDVTLASNVYAAFAALVPYGNEAIVKHHVIQAASATLHLHIENESVVMNIVSFFFACTQNGLKKEIKDVSAVLPTTMSALQKHPSMQLLAERAVAIAVECDSPLMETLVSLGLKQFPESAILRKYVNVINIERLRKRAEE